MKAIGIAAVTLVILFASRLSYAGETVRVGVYENSPKVSCDKSGKPAGFFIDILEYIAKKEGWTLEYVPGAWPECLTRLDRADIDLLVDIARTPERSQRYDFIKTSVLSDWVRLYRRPGLSINEWPDLQGKTIAVLKGSLQHGILVETLDKFGVQCNIKAVSTQKEVFQLLNDDDVDAGIVNRFFGCEYENDYTVERTPIIFAATDACFAMPRGHKPYLGEAIDRHLAEMKRNPDSYYYKILNAWLERYEHQKHGGIPRWIFISLAALLGGVVLLVANSAFLKSTVRRRTAELKTSMESLQESEARYRALFEGAAEGILVADIETKKFIYANPAICRMLGYTQEELVALGITDIHPAESLERIIAHFESNDDKQLIPDIPCLRKDGGVIYADITKAPAVVDGRECNVAFFTDVTQRKKLEEQFNQAQKLEAVGQLAGGVAHDFNNILTAQLGYCDLMKRRLRDEDPLAADLAQVKICAERAATLTRQLLAFSRKQTLEPKVLNLNDIVTNIEKMLRRLIGEHIES